VLYARSHFNLVNEDYSVIVLPGGNSAVMVLNRFATPSFMKRRLTKEQWHDKAKWIFNEGWNFEDDCPWSLSPIQTHIFTIEGKDYYYYSGYSRTQSSEFPYHQLGYLQNPSGEIVIVDMSCLDHEFMDHMGPDWQKWIDIAWAYIESPSVAFNSREWPLTAETQPPILPIFE
jgi:hypothetical protein